MSEFFMEAERKIPVSGESDVLVCGAGPAGVVAAISAARSGASVRLIEAAGCLGGIWTNGLLGWLLDINNKNGILREIIESLLQKKAGFMVRGDRLVCDSEEMKLLLEEMCIKEGIKIRLHTRVVGALTDESKTVKHIITESKSGREAWSAKVFIDASGDGDLGALAGCGYDFGNPENNEAQPMSLIAVVGGIELSEVDKFNRASKTNSDTAKKAFLAELQRAGVSPSYTDPFLAHIAENRFLLMVNHIYGALGTDADDITQATLKARREIHEIVTALRKSGKPWENLRVLSTAPHIGVREGRRIHGLYTVTADDMEKGKSFSCCACKVGFGIDIHTTNTKDSKDYQKTEIKAKPYEIPYGALIAKDVNNMLMAGRCISGDFYAHSSYRVTGNAAALGEAAGKLAAKAVKTNHYPKEIV